MKSSDKAAISKLFENLAQVERDGTPRDPEAERFISQAIARQPGAAYYMAQTVVAQEQALNAAQARIEQLEAQLMQAQRDAGGFFSGWFDDAPLTRQPATPPSRPVRGGGFLAGAAQTALGVAGGVLLANAVSGLFSGEAQAAQPQSDDSPDVGDDPFDLGDGW
jgi:uncharacterized protein